MKKWAAIATSGMLALSLCVAGCGAAQTSSNAQKSEEATEQTETEASVGGWEAAEAPASSYLTDEEQAIFDKAMAGQTDIELKPVAVVATQVVAGTNYAYLCQSTSQTLGLSDPWCIAVVYNDLEGNATLTGVNDLDVTNLQTATATEEGLTGAWAVTEPSAGAALPQEAATAFSDATAEYVGVQLSPVALLSTQVVAGTNYKVLCVGTTMAENPVQGLYVATIYQDLDGNAQVTDVAQLDVNAYVAMNLEQ